MKKRKLLVAAAILSTLMSTQAFAGQWQQDSNGWWYQNDNGSYPVNQWLEVDGKQYYFNSDGYMLHDTTTPDGYQVGADGAWIEEKPLFDFAINTCAIKYTDHKVVTDYDGYPALVIYYDYTNKDPEATGAWLADYSMKVFQNGLQCDTTFAFDFSDDSIDNYSKDILTGTTVNVAQMYRLTDMTDVTIQIKELWNWDNPQSQSVTISPN